MDIQSIVENDLVLDPSSVWVLKEHREFGYSDGAASERYLEEVFRDAGDLGSRSSELEARIRDWPSEYHLSAKRAQLLSGFNFDRSLKVLEVGCGCGAITRFLGESFDSVVSVEGSPSRARLARLRTRDVEGVSIVCAPFHKLAFSQPFDIIFCIGVYEYSASFVGGDDPYGATLRYFSDMLSPDGMLFIAIENQFGLKYFNASREDHLGTRFEGLEGYHARPAGVRTFGKRELECDLRKHFPLVRFYYPYPDYKLPDCVLDGEFLATGQAAELISQMKSRDHAGDMEPLWDEAPVLLELARNRMLEFFSNSFLVLAGKGAPRGVSFEQLAVLFSSGRKAAFATVSRVVRNGGNRLVVSKRLASGTGTADAGVLKLVDTDSLWADSHSLHTLAYLGCKSRGSGLETIFEPCKAWVGHLRRLSSVRGGVMTLGGEHIDSIWPNAYPAPDGCRVVDREWIWSAPIPMNVVVIRAIHDFLNRIEGARGLSGALDVRSGKALIEGIARAIGVDLRDGDFEEFVDIESELQSVVFGVEKWRHALNLRWFLFDRPTIRLFRSARRLIRRISAFRP
ncbi:MAG: class I SAM-dependent methyltransferase [Candidatus Nitricoxidivorans perseverans]|uniref:Class I SAM-dependent methyltransferase n=1 Tax=Candidatus Nitricoxidivorans perseverans TaxID=2975601 RepID=A0AA49FJV2_9PROT|nr:MAG: class I SAM-dependent methyltransferase [Candidatus Nitricoxidivorans perseverans]